MLFALALTVVGMVLGVLAGAVQGYFGGWVDLGLQRLIEIWARCPTLYLLIIFASIFEPSIAAAARAAVRCSAGSACRTTCAPSSCATAASSSCKAARALGLSNRADHVAPHPAELA